jgi:hypothetical protein
MRPMRSFAALMFLVACGGSGGGNSTPDGAKSADAHIFMDAPPVVPQMIKFSGVTSESTQSSDVPLAGVVVGVYASANESTPLAMATSDGSGAYTLMVPTNGSVVDGYIKATKSGYTDNYVYPAAPFQGDQLMANANLVTTSNFGLLGFLVGQTAGKGLIVAEILSSADASVMGATVASTPASGTYRYSDSGGTPTSTSSTNTDGASFMVNVPAGHVDISATKSGMVFKTHGLVAHADAFTTTVITQ